MVERVVGRACTVLALVSLAVPTGCPEIVFVKQRWAPLTQWTCDDQESRERAFACSHRERMDVILRATRPAKRKG